MQMVPPKQDLHHRRIMKSYRDYRVDQLFESINEKAEVPPIDLDRLMGPTSALGTGTQRANARVVSRLRAVLDDIQDDYPDPSEALKEIIKAATMLLGRTGWSFNPKQARKALSRVPTPDTEPQELPGEDGEEL